MRGAGGWGGDRGPTPEAYDPPNRAPDATVAEKIGETQALLYRLSGDDNPLHTDPSLAQAAGFAAPPVHGMRLMAAIEPALCAWRSDLRIAQIGATFAEPLLAGETARLSGRVLQSGEDEILMRVTIQGPRRGPCVVAEARLAPNGAPA